MQKLDANTRRERRVQVIRWVVIGPAGAAIPYILAIIIALFFGYDAAMDQLKSKLEFSSVLSSKTVSSTAITIYLAIATALAWFLAGRSGKPAAEGLVDKYWSSFDDSVLAKVRSPESRPAYDKFRVLPWIAPAGGRRAQLWTKLHDTILSATMRRGNGSYLPFGYILVVGQPGIGKSRLAVELARSLGQRSAINNADGAKILRNDYWHRIAPFRRRDTQGIWDAGFIKIAELEKLDRWKPSRPTLLILDDPPPTISAKCISALRVGSAGWRYPARLLIINQTLPADLGLVEQKGVWRADFIGTPPMIAPIVLDDGLLFSQSEIERCMRVLSRSAILPQSANALQIRQISEGNPFLVELALNRLLSDGNLENMSADDLVEERVNRVLKGLHVVGITDQHLPALLVLATSTLAGPPCPAALVIEKIPGGLIATGRLREAFPYQEVGDIDESLPSVRPFPIGARFVERVVHMSSPATTARLIVAAGWRANHFGMLRALIRGTRPGPLANALLEVPVEDMTSAERYALVGTIIEAAARREMPSRAVVGLLRQLIDVDAPKLTADHVAQLVAIGERVMREPATRGAPLAVAGTTVAAICMQAEAATKNVDGVVVAFNAFADFVVAATQRDVWLKSDEVALFIEQWSCLQDALAAVLTDADLPPSTIDAILGEATIKLETVEFENKELDYVLGRRMEQIFESMHGQVGDYFRELFRFFRVLDEGDFPPDLNIAALSIGARHPGKYLRFSYANFIQQCELIKKLAPHGLATALDDAISSLPRPDADLGPHPLLAIALGKSLKKSAYAHRHDARECARMLPHIDALAMANPGIAELAQLRLIVWRIAAFSRTKDPESCIKAVQRVEQLAKSMPATRLVRFNQVHAYRCLVEAFRDDPTRAMQTARYADHLATSFVIDRGLALERAQIWALTTNACNEIEQFIEIFERIEACFIGFEEDAEISTNIAAAYACAGRKLQNTDPERARKYADRAFALTVVFPDNVDLRHVRAGVRSYQFYLCEDDIASATARLDILREDLAWVRPRTAKGPNFDLRMGELAQYELEALSFVAMLSSHDVMLCRDFVAEASQIRDQFPESIVLGRLLAHSLAELAWAELRAGSTIVALAEMEKLLAKFKGDPEIKQAMKRASAGSLPPAQTEGV